jgi:hypothetical protein
MLLSCSKIGTVESVKGCRQKRDVCLLDLAAIEVTGIFRQKYAGNGMGWCTYAVLDRWWLSNVHFSVIGRNFLHANAYPSQL